MSSSTVPRPKCGQASSTPHDHLHRNHYGRLGCGPYPNAYRWAEDIQVRFRRRIAQRRRVPRRAALLAGAWKNLFAGVTTVVHHDAWEEDFDRDFPIRVARIAVRGFAGMTPGIRAARRRAVLPPSRRGRGRRRRGLNWPEVDRRGMLNSSLHRSSRRRHRRHAESDRFRQSGAALVWCPTSNHFLFRPLRAASSLDSGCDLLPGQRLSRLSGEGDLLDEIQAARELHLLDDERLEASVGSDERVALRRGRAFAPAGKQGRPYPPPKAPSRSAHGDVALTVVDGIPRIADAEVARKLGAWAEQGDKMRIGRTVRWTNRGRGVA